MPVSRRRLFLGLWAVWTLWSIVRLALADLTSDPSAQVELAPPARIDLNSARVGELALLPGVGGRRATDIVLRRVRRGPFRTLEELAEVSGCGLQTVERLRPFVELGAAGPAR